MGFGVDVQHAARLNAYETVPHMQDNHFEPFDFSQHHRWARSRAWTTSNEGKQKGRLLISCKQDAPGKKRPPRPRSRSVDPPPTAGFNSSAHKERQPCTMGGTGTLPRCTSPSESGLKPDVARSQACQAPLCRKS